MDEKILKKAKSQIRKIVLLTAIWLAIVVIAALYTNWDTMRYFALFAPITMFALGFVLNQAYMLRWMKTTTGME